jgi:hypothetical protein
MAGPVPVHVFWEPKIDVNLEAEAVVSVKSRLGMTLESRFKIFANYDIGKNPVLFHTLTTPSIEPDYILPGIEDEATIKASSVLAMSVGFGLYGGSLTGNMGLSAGLGMDVAFGAQNVGGVSFVPTIDKFDLGIEVAIPFSATFDLPLIDAIIIVEKNIYEKTWPIVTLPSMNLEILEDLKCTLIGGGSTGSLASVRLFANEEYPDDAFIDNGFTGSSDWYLTDASGGWVIGERETFEVDLERSGLGSFSSPPGGTAHFFMQPKIPPVPFLKELSSISLESLFADATGVDCPTPAPVIATTPAPVVTPATPPAIATNPVPVVTPATPPPLLKPQLPS